MKETITRLSRELNLPPDVVEKTYKAYWMFVRKNAESMPFKEELDEQTFSKLKPNMNVPNLGKLACTYDRYCGLKKRVKVLQNKYAKHKED